MIMKKRITTLLMAGLLAIGFCTGVSATEISRDSAENVFASGDLVTLPTAFFGGFAAGKEVEMKDAEAVGSVYMAGETVNIEDSIIDESLFVAGNSVEVKDTGIMGNVFAAGKSIKFSDKVHTNSVYAIGESVSFEGETSCLNLAGTTVIVDGKIDGDVNIDAQNVEISDDTVITGELIVNSSAEPEIPDDAEIGKFTYNKTTENEDSESSLSFGAKFLKKITSGIYWIVAMAAFGMLLCWLFDRHLETAANYIRNRTAPTIVSGILAWMCIPLAAILLCCSYILAPIAGMLSLAYVLLLCAGLAFAGASISRIVFPKMNVFLAALIGIAALEVIRMIPVIGFLVGAAADMYLLGYVVQSLWLNRKRKVTTPSEVQP